MLLGPGAKRPQPQELLEKVPLRERVAILHTMGLERRALRRNQQEIQGLQGSVLHENQQDQGLQELVLHGNQELQRLLEDGYEPRER